MGWGTTYDIQNAWIGPVPGGHAQVYAGLKSDEVGRFVANGAGQGVVVVVMLPHEAAMSVVTPGDEYLTPARTGSRKITAFIGTCLTLVSNTAQYTFDVSTRQWGCSPTTGTGP